MLKEIGAIHAQVKGILNNFDSYASNMNHMRKKLTKIGAEMELLHVEERELKRLVRDILISIKDAKREIRKGNLDTARNEIETADSDITHLMRVVKKKEREKVAA